MPTGTRPLPGPLSLAVARIVGEALRSQGRLQSDVAADADMSAAQFSRALAGKKVFTLDQLDAVCTSLGLVIAEVIKIATREARPQLALVSDEPVTLPTPEQDPELYGLAAKRGRRHTEEP